VDSGRHEAVSGAMPAAAPAPGAAGPLRRIPFPGAAGARPVPARVPLRRREGPARPRCPLPGCPRRGGGLAAGAASLCLRHSRDAGRDGGTHVS
jgi:hypothetical protein